MPSVNLANLVPSVGFAIFLVINATQVWGGIFPFLPLDFQTDTVTLSFYSAQALAFVGAFAVSVVGSYWLPQEGRRMLVRLATALVAAGSVCVIAAMYARAFTMALVLAGGASLGVGTAAFFMLWQRYFAAIEPEQCNLQLMLGTAFSALLYFALYLVPVALTAFLVPAVMLPLSALCLTLSVRRMNLRQPMFEDRPRERAEVYKRLILDSWRSAAGIGALGFACGLARGAALYDPSLGTVVNIASMGGSLIAAILLLALSHFRSVRFSMNQLFRAFYPLIITGLLLFPFFQKLGLSLFAGATYLLFSTMTLVMMMQAAQTSRDRGVSPVFIYGFLGTAAYLAQSVAFLLGWNAHNASILGVGQTTFLSLIAAYVLGLALYWITRPARTPGLRREDRVEIIRTEHPEALLEEDGKQRKSKGADGSVLKDRLSKQCLAARSRYGLSTREAEVMELIARNLTVAAIARELYISENTVRTHSKHVYTKMDVHSKQELSQLLDKIDL